MKLFIADHIDVKKSAFDCVAAKLWLKGSTISFALLNKRIWMNVKHYLCVKHLFKIITLQPTNEKWKLLYLRNQRLSYFISQYLKNRRSLVRKKSTFSFPWEFKLK